MWLLCPLLLSSLFFLFLFAYVLTSMLCNTGTSAFTLFWCLVNCRNDLHTCDLKVLLDEYYACAETRLGFQVH